MHTESGERGEVQPGLSRCHKLLDTLTDRQLFALAVQRHGMRRAALGNFVQFCAQVFYQAFMVLNILGGFGRGRVIGVGDGGGVGDRRVQAAVFIVRWFARGHKGCSYWAAQGPPAGRKLRLVAEKLPGLDAPGYLAGDHFFPGTVAGGNFTEHIGREDSQIFLVETLYRFDIAVLF